MGLIGNDDYGKVILDSIRGREINGDHLYQVEGETAHHVIHIDETGDRYFKEGAWHGGVVDSLTLSDSDIELLHNMDVVITTLWQPTLKQLVELKEECGYLLAVDFNDQREFGSWESLIDGIDVFFSSATDTMKPEFQRRSEVGDTIFVLTFGEHGSTAFQNGSSVHCPAVKVDKVVDTTGCGDCYQGNFVVEYALSGNIVRAMDRGAREAAKVTQHVGGFVNDVPG